MSNWQACSWVVEWHTKHFIDAPGLLPLLDRTWTAIKTATPTAWSSSHTFPKNNSTHGIMGEISRSCCTASIWMLEEAASFYRAFPNCYITWQNLTLDSHVSISWIFLNVCLLFLEIYRFRVAVDLCARGIQWQRSPFYPGQCFYQILSCPAISSLLSI